MALRILYVSERAGTCQQRRRGLEELGHEVHYVEAGEPHSPLKRQLYRVGHHLSLPPDLLGAHASIESAVDAQPFDVLWMDKGRTLKPSLLRSVRRRSPRTQMVSYSPDDMTLPYHSSIRYRACLPLFDLLVTTKSYITDELQQMGARRVMFIGNAYDPAVHRPLELSEADRARLTCGVGFIGTFEEDRARLMYRLAESGVPVSIRGYGWSRSGAQHDLWSVEEGHLDQSEYVKVINATEINLGFLRKGARDQQTTRSIEIPGCRAFMLAERTAEHQALFSEGIEAEFFEGFDELLEKCRRYLAAPEARARIARAGFERCRVSGYSNRDRLASVLEALAR